ncbi:MAG: D-inositol-3-phosphate glycosyltransferase, partial [Actinomycetota bacterium]|nr:D-inositol-3-phosphate glycosyltransferase [Actinomycetota bacterium]
LAYVVEEGRSGFLVDGWDPADYADAALRLLSDRELAGWLSAGAWQFSQDFSWKATGDRLVELYEGISSQ